MKCAAIKNYLADYVADELDFSNSRKVKLHLEKCSLCEKEAGVFKNSNYLLKTLPPIVPSAKFDEQMMQSFRKHQQTTQRPTFWTTVFARFSISKPALAFALLTLLIFTGAAFQLGRTSLPDTQMSQTFSQLMQASEPNQIVKIVEKRVEVPIIKTIEVPVYKERIVNRVIYKNREVFKTIKIPDEKINEIRVNNFDSQNTAFTFVQNDNETFTPINLKNFQTASEIKISVIKRGKNNEQ